MYFFAIALVFLLLEFFMSDTRNRRSLFGRSGKTLAVLAAVMVLSPAVLSAQSDRSEVRAGNRDFKKGMYREAEIDYKRALIADSASVTAKYNLGNALYKAESYNEAELYFKDLGDTLKNLSSSKASDYFHISRVRISSNSSRTRTRIRTSRIRTRTRITISRMIRIRTRIRTTTRTRTSRTRISSNSLRLSRRYPLRPPSRCSRP